LETQKLRCKASLRTSQLESQLIRFRGVVNERNDLVDALLMADLQAMRWGFQEEPIAPHKVRTGPIETYEDLTEDEIRRLRSGELSYTRKMVEAGIHMQVGRSKSAAIEEGDHVIIY